MNITKEDDELYYKMAIDFVKSNPVEFIENVFLRLGYFYGWQYYFRQVASSYPISLSPENVEELKAEASAIYSQPNMMLKSLIYSISAFPLFLMSLAGLIITRPILKRNRQIILLFIAFFTLVHILSIANIRHRQPIDALLTLYASGFALWFLEKLKLLRNKDRKLSEDAKTMSNM